MSARLEGLIEGARGDEVAWDPDRAERVRLAALRRRDGRVRSRRLVQRGLLVAGGAGLLVLALLRGAASAPAELQASQASTSSSTASPGATVAAPATAAAPAPAAEALAARTLGDAGYARD